MKLSNESKWIIGILLIIASVLVVSNISGATAYQIGRVVGWGLAIAFVLWVANKIASKQEAKRREQDKEKEL